MSKTFKYTKFTGHYYCQYSDEWEQDGVEFEYEVENSELIPVLVDLMFKDYFGEEKVFNTTKKLVKKLKEKLATIIDEQDLASSLADNYEDALKEIFHDEAMDYYNS